MSGRMTVHLPNAWIFVIFILLYAPIASAYALEYRAMADRRQLNNCAPIAQLVERLPFKEKVGGSNPSGRTIKTAEMLFFVYC